MTIMFNFLYQVCDLSSLLAGFSVVLLPPMPLINWSGLFLSLHRTKILCYVFMDFIYHEGNVHVRYGYIFFLLPVLICLGTITVSVL